MKNSLKYALLVVFTFIANPSFADEISVEVIKNQLASAHNQYLSGHTQRGVDALDHLAFVLESHQSASLETQIGPNNLAYTYVRLGLLHEKSGDSSKASGYFSKAIQSYKGDKAELEQLKAVVRRLDNQGRS